MSTKHLAAGATILLSATIGLAACGSDESMTSDGGAASPPPMSQSPSMSQSPPMSQSPSMSGGAMMAAPFGPACSQIPKTGAGSAAGMAKDPVATAASNNPMLSTLVTAVQEAGLTQTLNSAKDITVFAPADSAFEKLPEATLEQTLADKDALAKLLTHHVVPGKLTPRNLAGTHETLAGDRLQVMGSGENFTVGKSEAKVLCGNVQTANATVYIVDGVLMP